MNSYDILVIILSVTLAILLVLSIIFMVYLIKIAKHVRTLTEKAESVMNNVTAASKVFKKSAGPVAVSRILANILDGFSGRKKRKRDDDDE